MSDHVIVLLPDDPRYAPTSEMVRLTVERLHLIMPQAQEIETKRSDEVRFVDAGGYFDRVLCPACGAEIDIAWWQDRMDAEQAKGFPLIPRRVPCCGAERALNDLVYDWPQGFARFTVEITNPGTADLTPEQVRELGELLGCRLRKIFRRV